MKGKTRDQVVIYDTTLRDGTQAEEISLQLTDKIAIAQKLDELGVDFIEAGWPGSNPKDAEVFEKARNLSLSHARITAFGSTRRKGIKASDDPQILALLKAAEVITIFGKSWHLHVKEALRTTLEENLEMIHDSVSFLSENAETVFYDAEHFFDGYKDNPEYALKTLEAAQEGGARCLVLCDTNGGTLPLEIETIARTVRDRLPDAQLGAHMHNDSECAVANSLIMVEQGARHVQGTINGWGERCGNADLCVFIPNAVLKMGHQPACAPHLTHLTSLSRFVAEKANIIADKRQPYVGKAAFSHKAGQHADVVAKADSLMEHIDSGLVGNQRQILLSELAGKSTVVEKLSKYGDFGKGDAVVRDLIDVLKARERDGYEYEAAEASFDLLVRRALKTYEPIVELRNYHLESYKAHQTPSKTVGRIFMQAHGRELMGAAVGVGPVETLDHALRDALAPHYPFIAKIGLTDYRVRVLNPERASAAKVRVFITSTDHEGRSWDTVGVNENIVEASWEALVDSLEWYYNEHCVERKEE